MNNITVSPAAICRAVARSTAKKDRRAYGPTPSEMLVYALHVAGVLLVLIGSIFA